MSEWHEYPTCPDPECGARDEDWWHSTSIEDGGTAIIECPECGHRFEVLCSMKAEFLTIPEGLDDSEKVEP